MKPHELVFRSHRSPVYGINGMVASSQPLASEIGLRVLQDGGNAADAAVAVAAALNVTEPTSTGIGGDCFCLFYDASKKSVEGINGSGRAPSGLNIEILSEMGFSVQLPSFSVHTITVPGAAAGWVDTIEKFGSKSMDEVLQPAIALAEKGFPVSPLTARGWARGVERLMSGPNGGELLRNGKAPKAGEIMKNPYLARTFRELSAHGKSGFYEGRITEEIVRIIQAKGGLMNVEDIKAHHSTFPEPVSTNYRGIDVYEIPPNGQGITALIALNILEDFDLVSLGYLSTDYLHLLIESLRLAFADTRWYVADPDVVDVPTKELISKEYAKKRRSILDMEKASVDVEKGSPIAGSDTVYFCVVDGEGNACSFINSNYMGFGTGLVPKGCGFTLQNRGANFSLIPDHPNCIAPRKRPYHTIIPGMAVKDGNLFGPFGVMGGFMQPQGHVQVIVDMVDFGFDPQTALDSPRFCILGGMSSGKVGIEEGIPVKTMSELVMKGHEVVPLSGYMRGACGRGQIILRNPDTGALCAGSDPRADGLAIGW